MSLYHFPRLIILLLVLIVVMGNATLETMPRLEDPHLTNRNPTVLTFYPGANAERVEALVTEPLEKKLREVAEVDEIKSTSRANVSSIQITLKDSVVNEEEVLALLRDKVSEVVDLPAGASEPLVDDNRIYAFTSIVALKWISRAPVNYSILGRYAEELDTRLRYITGTDFVTTIGRPAEEVAVTVDQRKLGPLGLTAAQVAQLIFAADSKNAAGTVVGDANSFLVKVDGSLDSLDRIRAIPLAFRTRGAVVRVGDVATVERTIRTPARELALAGDKPAVFVGARMLESFRIDRWSARADAVIAEFSQSLPAGIEAEIIFSQDGYTAERLGNLMGNLVVGALIVIGILLVTLGWKASILAGSILPLASLSALAILNAMGWQIQQMLVTGMIVALGIMVDNAIVVTEGVQSRLRRGDSRDEAVANTLKRLWLPLLGSTITTIIAFLPIILMPGSAGEFVGGISAAVIASLITSYVISFTIIVAIAGRIISRSEQQAGDRRVWWRDGVAGKTVSSRFRRSLDWSLARPKLSIALSSLLPLLGFVMATTLTQQFFPPADRDQFHIEFELPVSASIAETQALVAEASALIKADPRIVSLHWSIGKSVPKFYYNLLSNKDNVPSFAQAMVTATSVKAADALIDPLQTQLDNAFPTAQILVRKLEQGPPFIAPLEMKVIGPDLEVLRELGEQVRQEMLALPSVTHAQATLEVGRPEIVVRPDEDEARLVGLSMRDIADQLRASLDGETGGSILEETEEVPVRVRVNPVDRNSIDDIRNLDLNPATGARVFDDSFQSIPLMAIADVTLQPSIGAIPRLDGERVNFIQGFLTNGTLPDAAFQAFQERLAAADIAVPAGYRIEVGGENAERNEAVGKLLSAAGVLAVLMVIAIVLTFNSFRMGAITFAAAIQAAGLGLLSLWLSGYPSGFVVIVGIMGLIGLAINATIVILSEMRAEASCRAGDDTAMVDAVMHTGRHILSTTLTTVGGFMPLILAAGDFWPPFAISIAGGAFLSMIVSFYFGPAAFKLWVGGKRALGGFDRAAGQVDEPAPRPQLQAAE